MLKKTLIYFTILTMIISYLPLSVFAAETIETVSDSVSISTITKSGDSQIKSLNDLNALPTSINGVSINWSILSQTVQNSIVMESNQITAVTRPQVTIDNTVNADQTYTTTTGKITNPAYDSFVVLNAEFILGDQTLNKPYYLIVKRDDNALASNMFLDNFEHGSVKGWDGTQILDTSNILNNTSKKINPNVISAKYNSGFARAMPVNVANYKHIQAASFRMYINNTTAGRAQNFQLRSGTNSNIIAHMRIAADKIYVSNGQGTVTAVASLTPVDPVSGTAPATLSQQKWYEVQYVVDFANTYGLNDAKYDVYIYEYDYQTGAKTLFAYKTGLAAAVANTSAPADSSLYIARLVTDPYSMQASSYDDISITDYTVDVSNAKTSLTLPTTIRSGTVLPTVGSNETSITWSTTNTDVAINNGIISFVSPLTTKLQNINLTATIKKGVGVSGAISAVDTKQITLNMDNALMPEFASANDVIEYYKQSVAQMFINGEKTVALGKSVTLPQGGKYSTSISWTLQNSDYAQINGDILSALKQPPMLEDDIRLNLKCSIVSRYNSSTDVMQEVNYTIIVPAVTPQNDVDKFNADLQSLLKGIDLTNVTDNLSLITLGRYGSTIVWTSSDVATISNSGIVNRPNYYIGDKAVTLSALITLAGYSQTKNFNVVVKANTEVTDSIFFDKTFNNLNGSGYNVTNNDGNIRTASEDFASVGGNDTSKMLLNVMQVSDYGLVVDKSLGNKSEKVLEVGFSFFAQTGMDGNVLLKNASGENILYYNIKTDGTISLNPFSTTSDSNHKYVALDQKYTLGKWNKLVCVIDTKDSDRDTTIDPARKMRLDIFLYTTDFYDGDNTIWVLKSQKATIQSNAPKFDGTDSLSSMQINAGKGSVKKVYFDDIYLKDANIVLAKSKSSLNIGTQITADGILLPTKTAEGYSIEWESDDPNSLEIVSTTQGKKAQIGIVVENQKNVNLKANVKYVGSTISTLPNLINLSTSKTFPFVLDKNFTVTSNNDAIYYYKRFAMPQGDVITVDSNNYTLPTTQIYNTSVSWQLVDNQNATLSNNVISVIQRPQMLEPDLVVNLKGIITTTFEGTTLTQEVTYSAVMTHIQPVTDTDKFNVDKASILRGIDLNNVTSDLPLVTTATYGSKIAWTTSDDNYVKTTGAVTRTDYYIGDKTVTLTATITYLTLTATIPYTVVIKKTAQADSTPYIFKDTDFSNYSTNYTTLSTPDTRHSVSETTEVIGADDSSKLVLETSAVSDANLIVERNLYAQKEKVVEVGFCFYTTTGMDGSIFINNVSGSNLLYYNIKPDGTISLNPSSTTSSVSHKYFKLENKYALGKWNKLVCVIDTKEEDRNTTMDENNKAKMRYDVLLYTTDWYKGDDTVWTLVAKKATIQSTDPASSAIDRVDKLQFSMSKSSAKKVYFDDIYLKDCEVVVNKEASEISIGNTIPDGGLVLPTITSQNDKISFVSSDSRALKVVDNTALIGTIEGTPKDVNLIGKVTYVGDINAGIVGPVSTSAQKSFGLTLQPNFSVTSKETAIEYFKKLVLFEEDIYVTNEIQSVTLPTLNKFDTNVVWTMENSDFVSFDNNVVTVLKRPTMNEADKNTLLTATVTSNYGGGTPITQQYTFNFTIEQTRPVTEQQKFEADYMSVLRGIDLSNVTENVSLPTTGRYGSKIVYMISENGKVLTVDDASVIKYDGTVTRPSNKDGSKTVKIDVVVTRADTDLTIWTSELSFNVTVIKTYNNKDKLIEVADQIIVPSSLTADINLPSSLLFATNIEWTSANENYIKIINNNGIITAKVTRPTDDYDRIVTLSAKLIHNGTDGNEEIYVSYSPKVLKVQSATVPTGGKGIVSSPTTFNNSNSNIPASLQPVTPQIQVFSDIGNYTWAKDAIESLYNKGVVNGVDKGEFAPANSVKREEFIKMLVIALNLKADENQLPADVEGNSTETISTDKLSSSFTDVNSSEWYAPYVNTVKKLSIVGGYPDGSFGVGSYISREEMAVITYRALKSINRELPEINPTATFGDYSDISDYAQQSAIALRKAGMLNGDENGNFLAKNNLTRAETAKLIYTLIKL